MAIFEIFTNEALICAALGWFTAQFMKVIFVLLFEKKLDFKRLIGTGGMPSSHSSFVMSLTTYVGLLEGFDSTAFAICCVLAFVVMYDAAGIRRAAGKQAEILNQILEHRNDPSEIKTKRLKELLGHTPFEVFAGAAVGIVVALVSYFLIFQ